MLYTKPKNNKVKFWITRLIQVALILGILFFGYEAINRFTSPQLEEPQAVEVIVLQPQINVLEIHPVVVVETNPVPAEPALDANDYYRLGLEHHLSNELGEAIMDYSRSLALDETVSASWLNRGVAYEQMGNHYRAMYDYMRFIQRDGISIGVQPLVTDDTNMRVNVYKNTVQAIPMSLNSGDIVSISVSSVEENLVDPLIIVVDTEGNPVAANDDVRRQDGSIISMNSSIDKATVNQTGGYILLVSHAGGGEYGINSGAVDINIRIDQ
jgi:hypothetical protein